MQETLEARSGGATYTIVIDRRSGRWSAKNRPDESTFPLVAHLDGKRYEIYSDDTFAEVDDADESEA